MIDEKLPKRDTLPKRAEELLSILTPDQIRRLTLACGDSLRDRTILAILLDTGIRASELCGLRLDRVYLTQDDAYLTVLGKGRKVREVGLGRQSSQSFSATFAARATPPLGVQTTRRYSSDGRVQPSAPSDWTTSSADSGTRRN